jgi:hypothetical protein
MYYFYNINPERRNAWRNAHEIRAAAIEHEKRRYQMIQRFSQAKQLTPGKQRAGWIAALFSIIK